MTRPMHGFGRTVRAALLLTLAFVTGAVAHRAVTPIAPETVHLSGDGAAQLAADLFVWPGPAQAADPASATTQVITARRWQNLEGLEDVARLCGVACDGRAGIVTIRRPSLNGLTQVILVDLGDHGAGEMLDEGAPIPEEIIGCVIQAIKIARTGGTWKITKCDVPDDVTITRPRFWTPSKPSSGFLRGL